MLDVSDLGKTNTCFPCVHVPAVDNGVQHIHGFVCTSSRTILQSELLIPAGKPAFLTVRLSMYIFSVTSNVVYEHVYQLHTKMNI